MNSFYLKIIACSLMLIDHIGAILYPEQIFWRIIGRLTLPIFAYLLAVGFQHTKSIKKYLTRLFIFAVFSQPIYYWAFQNKNLNIFFTLLFGLVAIWLFSKIKNKFFGWLAVLLLALSGEIIKLDYGWYGIMLVFFFYFFPVAKDFIYLFITQTGLTVIYVYYHYSLGKLAGYDHSFLSLVQLFAILSLFILKFYNGQLGPRLKYIFYFFYPVHLLVLVIIKKVIDNI